ncbi:MAG: type II toxin-antitoxin system HicB family antitoxin [Chloroflexi bacterium]|nr:type II toxin-antitoxin system HicB family antitoxin [Chloroflexota bacterium]
MEQEEGGYTVICPALPGCVSEGETREEALKNIREAITGYLEAADMQAQMAPEGIQVERVLV